MFAVPKFRTAIWIGELPVIVLSAVQAQAILDLSLHRLTGLEQDKIIEEFKEYYCNDPRSIRYFS